MKYATIGSISTGTLRPEDLLASFAAELEHLIQRNAEAWCSDRGRAVRDAHVTLIWNAREALDEDGELTEDADADELIAELSDALQMFAPDYCDFGAHPGDGADFGFWLSEEWQQQARDDGVRFADDLADIPDDYRGLACVVNDHGNATLYAFDVTGARTEIWSVV